MGVAAAGVVGGGVAGRIAPRRLANPPVVPMARWRCARTGGVCAVPSHTARCHAQQAKGNEPRKKKRAVHSTFCLELFEYTT